MTEHAAGVIAKSPFGRILMVRRTDGQGWAFPGGGMHDGESEQTCATREFLEETGYRLGRTRFLMRRVRDGVDFTTFLADVDDEFVPKLNHEHDCWGWFDPQSTLDESAVASAPIAATMAIGDSKPVPVPPSLHPRADAGTFKEEDHPREKGGEKGGQFTSGGGGGGGGEEPSPKEKAAPAEKPAGGGITSGKEWTGGGDIAALRSVKRAQARGGFKFKATETTPRSKWGAPASTTYSIMPDDIPGGWGKVEKSRGRVEAFDPEFAEEKDGYAVPKDKDADRAALPKTQEPGVIYRGMSWEEYQGALKNGEFKSKGAANIGEAQKGLTLWSSKPSQAASYANDFAGWQDKASPSRPAVMVAIHDPGEDSHVYTVPGAKEEIGLREAMPMSAVKDVYIGNATIVSSGEMQVKDRDGQPEEGSSSGGSTYVRWSKQAAAPTAMPASIKSFVADWAEGGDWEDSQHAAKAVISGQKRDDYICYDCHGDDGERYDRIKEVLDAIEQAPVIGKPLYRGLASGGGSYKVGDKFSESLTSWTGKQDLAGDFASGKYKAPWEKVDKPTVLEVLSSTTMKGFDVSSNLTATEGAMKDADEWLTSGQYEVAKVTEGNPRVVEVRRLGPAKEDKDTKIADEAARVAKAMADDAAALAKIASRIDELFGRSDEAPWDESKHPRGQPGNAGQFGAGGGSPADPEKSGENPEKSGVSGEPKQGGENQKSETGPAGGKAKKWSGAGGVEEENSAEPVTGKPISVMRLGSEKGGIAGRNAGNLRAVAHHLVNSYDEFSSAAHGDTISVYHATLPEDVGGYEASNAGKGTTGKFGRSVKESGKEGINPDIGYSFPKDYEGQKAFSIPIKDVIGELNKRGYSDPDDAGINETEDALREVLSKAESKPKSESKSATGKASQLLSLYPSTGRTADDIIATMPGMAEKIAKVKDRLKAGVPTDQLHKKDGAYTPERNALHSKILNEIFSDEAIANARPPKGQKPTVTFLGGRGGSGKSWMTKPGAGPIDAKHAITLNSDDVQEKFPEYEGWNAAHTHDEAAEIVNQAEEMARRGGLNVILDATLRTQGSVERKLEAFEKAGYDVHGYYMFLPPEEAAKRALERFDRGGPKGRFVPPEYTLGSTTNEKTFDAMAPSLKKWAVYENTGKSPQLVSNGAQDG